MLLYGADDDVANWIAYQLFKADKTVFGTCNAIGITRDQKLIAGVVYNNYHESPSGVPLSIEMSIASIDKRWATRHNIRALYSYPFTDLRVRRVNTFCSAKDEGVIMFNQKLGFTREGYHPQLFEEGDAISWGMLREDCKWL